MNCAHDFSPLDTNYARWLLVFLKDMAKLPEVHPESMMLSWRECVLYNGVIGSATVVVLDMVAVTHIS